MPKKHMPDKHMPDKHMPGNDNRMHSDAWWIRALDGELTSEEQRAWEAHLVRCARCRLEWEALAGMDRLFVTTPVPASSPDFVAKTAAKVGRAAWRQRLASLLGGLFIVAVLIVAEILAFNAIFSGVTRVGGTLLASRDLLFQAWMRIWVSLIALGDATLPLMCIGLAAALLLVMPNGILATLTFLLVRRQRRAQSVKA